MSTMRLFPYMTMVMTEDSFLMDVVTVNRMRGNMLM
jgi:hypothetical protein